MFEKIDGKLVLTKYEGKEKTLVIPETFESEPVTEIGEYSFFGNDSILEVILPKSIEVIGMYAFKFCHNLKRVQLNEGLTDIPAHIFADCSSLTEISIPSSVKVIKAFAFASCSNLRKIHLNEGLTEICDNAFEGCTSLQEITFPSSVTTIGNRAFKGCELLKEITFPSTIKKLGNYSFGNCTGLTKAILLNDLQFKAEGVFGNASKLEDVNLALLINFSIQNQCYLVINMLNKFESYTIDEQHELISYVKRTATIRRYIFDGNNPKVISILIHENLKLSLEEIQESLEYSINNEFLEVTAILLEYKNNNFTVKEIADFHEQNELVEIGLAFPSLKQLEDKWHVARIDGGLKITGYKGKNTTEIIPERTASNIPILQVYRGNNKTYEPIEILTIDAKIEGLKHRAFLGFETLRELHIPETLTKLVSSCFERCANLEVINSLEYIKQIEGNPFLYCEKLANEEGFIIIGDTLYQYFGRVDVVEVPVNVKVVQSFSFINNELKEISFSEGLYKICENAFCNCKSLKKVTISKYTQIDDYAFDERHGAIEIIRF